MIVVTGGAGFIGSNIVKGLNDRGIKNILVVDDLTDGRKFKNIVDCQILDYLDKDDFLAMLEADLEFPEDIECIFHEGACSDTTEWDGKFMMKNNYDYSVSVLNYCLEKSISFIYASSAATYGGGNIFKEELQYERPLNMYGYSKFLFDQYVRRLLPNPSCQIVGMRYFNVYGPRESHKGSMASVAYHNHNQIKSVGEVKLFEGCDGYGNGEQSRDFIYVADVVNVNLWFYDHKDINGIFNIGTGRSQPFNDISKSVIDWHQKGEIKYIPFPEHLVGRYQSFTEADISALRAVGYDHDFMTVQQGVKAYLDWLAENED